MATHTKTIKATCLCGDAAHKITLPSTAYPLPSYFCTCNSCRHMTGTLFLSTAFLPPTYKPSPFLLSKLTSFNFSNRITQYFCKRCGSTMLAHCLPNPKQENPDRREENWDVMTGTLETFDGMIDLKGYEYIHDTLDGGFSDFMPTYKNRLLDRWPHDINEKSQLPLNWRSPEPSTTAEQHPNPKTRLHAHCKCAGISFYIARPSLQSTRARRAWPDLLIPHYAQKEKEPDEQQKLPHEPWFLRASNTNSNTKFLAGLCACTSCRLASGMEITAWAFVPAGDVSLDAEGEVALPTLSISRPEGTFGTLRSYNSSPGVTRSFCSTCGAIVFWSETELSETSLLDVAVGLLEAEEGSRAEGWLEWWTERLSFREDASRRARGIVEGIEAGLKEFRERGDRDGV
jgi:hypothetical protein